MWGGVLSPVLSATGIDFFGGRIMVSRAADPISAGWPGRGTEAVGEGTGEICLGSVPLSPEV